MSYLFAIKLPGGREYRSARFANRHQAEMGLRDYMRRDGSKKGKVLVSDKEPQIKEQS